MANKENKGGILSNEQVEQDLQANGRTPQENDAYRGVQDTGDKEAGHLGNAVTQNDGRPADAESGE